MESAVKVTSFSHSKFVQENQLGGQEQLWSLASLGGGGHWRSPDRFPGPSEKNCYDLCLRRVNVLSWVTPPRAALSGPRVLPPRPLCELDSDPSPMCRVSPVEQPAAAPVSSRSSQQRWGSDFAVLCNPHTVSIQPQ